MTLWTVFFMVTTGIFFIRMVVAIRRYQAAMMVVKEALRTISYKEETILSQEENLQICRRHIQLLRSGGTDTDLLGTTNQPTIINKKNMN